MSDMLTSWILPYDGQPVYMDKEACFNLVMMIGVGGPSPHIFGIKIWGWAEWNNEEVKKG